MMRGHGKCFMNIKDLAKAYERLLEAEQAYIDGRHSTAIAKIGGAFTSLALAYEKGVISTDEWKKLNGALYHVREAIISFSPVEELIDKVDIAKKMFFDKILEKYYQCMRYK